MQLVEASISQGAGGKEDAEADAAQARAAGKDRSDSWVKKFAVMDKIYNELKTLYNGFIQAGFPEENPWPLDMTVNDVKYALENYESSMKSGKQSLSQGVESNLAQALRHLNKDGSWKMTVKYCAL